MKTPIFKTLICLVMVLAITLPMVSCGDEDTSYQEGQYLNVDGTVTEKENVTLDVISLQEYNKKFDKLKDSAKRQKVISLYLDHHLTASDETQASQKKALINQISGIDINLSTTNTNIEKGIALTDDLLSKASTAISLADFYAKINDNSGFEKFVEKVSKTCRVAELALKFSKACYIVADLSNNDISNKQEYCDDIIDALSFITSHVPFFDDYFTQSLDIIKKGVQLVIKNYQHFETLLQVYDAEIDGTTLFSVKNFECILKPDQWGTDYAPTIAQVLKREYLYNTIPKGTPLQYFKEYILFRVSYESQNPVSNKEDSSIDFTQPLCKHLFYAQGEVIKSPTCTEEGTQRLSCMHCKAKEDIAIKKLDHDYENTIKFPTYKTEGYTMHTCKDCGYFYASDFTDPLPIKPPVITGPTTWYGKGRMHYSHTRYYEIRIDAVNEETISGYLEVYRFVSGNKKYKHQTAFQGTGKKTDDGYVYTIKFDKSVSFGVIPMYTYTEMDLYYNTEKDTFSFKTMYQVTMNRK